MFIYNSIAAAFLAKDGKKEKGEREKEAKIT